VNFLAVLMVTKSNYNSKNVSNNDIITH